MILYIVLIIILLVLFLIGKTAYKFQNTKIDTKKTIPKILYPAVLFWLYKCGYLKWTSTKKRIETTQMLYPGCNGTEIHVNQVCHQLSVIYLLLLLISIVCVACQASSHVYELDSITLMRPPVGGLDREEHLSVILRERDKETKQDISFFVTARKYTDNELYHLKSDAKQQIYTLMKGENDSLESVIKPIHLIESIDGNPYRISWDVSGQDLIDDEGKLHNKLIKTKTIVSIKACLSYKKDEEYLTVYIGVEPYQWSWSEEALTRFQEYLNSTDTMNITQSSYKLPDHIGSMKISYEQDEGNKAVKIFLLGLILCIAIWMYWIESISKRRRYYSDECQRGYPAMVSKLSLLIGAGMTVKGAWHRMVQDYCKEKQRHPEYYSYVYEEMIITWNEMENGITEHDAFIRYGRRMKLRSYMRLATLIAQNLKKGTKGFLLQMEMEVRQSQEERKQAARRLGEEAGTKMLFPMLIMLVIVLVIIMVPAFLSFSEGGL